MADDREGWYRDQSAKLYGKPLAPCACGAAGQWDDFDAGCVWVECSANCGKETHGYIDYEEAAKAWAAGEYQ